jgi:hypothetical protein
MNRGFVIFIMMLLFPTISIYGKTNNKSAVKRFVTKKKSISFIDPSVDVLPANYRGANIYDLYQELGSKISEKTEFETADEYKRSVVERLPKEFMAFMINPNKSNGYDCYLKYNPESNELIAEYSTRDDVTYSTGVRHTVNTVDLMSVNERESEYVGTNGFGASVRVSSTLRDVYGLIVVNKSAGERKVVSIAMSPDDAKQNKGEMRFLLICKVKFSDDELKVTDRGIKVLHATIDFPSEYIDRKFYVFVNVSELWVYNYKTGFVYTKVKYD